MVGVLGFRYFTFPFKTFSDSQEFTISEKFEKQISRFSGGLKIPTVSNEDYSLTNFKPFIEFQNYLFKSYPVIYKKLNFIKINSHSLVFHWKGRNSDLSPILFLSHYDVVPAGDKSLWKSDPFSGKVENGMILGRGTIDMKSMLFSLLDATELLLEENFTPERDIYFAFGHDEEVGGAQGAAKVSEYFQNKKIQFEAVYDEGGIVSGSGIAGLKRDIALIGLAEKGFSSVVIKVKGEGGHSSMPPLHTALGKAAVIMQRLEDNQFKPRLIEPMQDFLINLASDSGFLTKLAVSNQWLLQPLLISKLSKVGASNALIRTTTALTMSKGSEASNVLPSIAEVVVNFRLLPGDTLSDVRHHVEKLCEGFEVEISSIGDKEASRISPKNSYGFTILSNSIARYFPNAMITPYITIGGTDASRYESVSQNVYRFLPVRLTNEERGLIHNVNESISTASYKKMILFFKDTLKVF